MIDQAQQKVRVEHLKRKLLTGYVVNFNKRHRRHGHLFQNFTPVK